MVSAHTNLTYSKYPRNLLSCRVGNTYSSEREEMKDGTIEAMSDALQLRAHKSNTALDRCTSTSAPSLRHHILLHRHVSVKEGEGCRGYAEAHGLHRLAASESQGSSDDCRRCNGSIVSNISISTCQEEALVGQGCNSMVKASKAAKVTQKAAAAQYQSDQTWSPQKTAEFVRSYVDGRSANACADVLHRLVLSWLRRADGAPFMVEGMSPIRA